MRKWQRSGFLLIFLFSGQTFLFAQTNKTEEIPPWMEKVDKRGQASYLVPKGSKAGKFGAEYKVETTEEFVARRFYEIDQRLAKAEQREEDLEKELDEKLENLQKQLADLNTALQDMKKESAVQATAGGAIPIESFDVKEP
ncbi:MAG: hypothetical protein HZA28_04075 [Candidatus Omnitrophica bacterium]|nr:hypothetical protein [Candidatus Omnitrophota bacterium]